MVPLSLIRVATLLILIGALFEHDVHLACALIVAPPSGGMQQLGMRRFVNHPTTILYAASNDDDAEKDANDSQSDDDAMTEADLDQKKNALENMLKGGSGESSAAPSMNSSVLTSTRKQRLEREIDLLKQLDPEHPENNSEFVDLQNQEFIMADLWSLWYGERGSMNERKLKAIEETLGDPDLWPQAENEYLELIREHCTIDGSMDKLQLSNWVEPANRLATLLFLMGRYKESKNWCEKIINAKPWHIGALSGIVMVCMRIGDKEGVLKYSMLGLPNLTPQMRNSRREWVQRNVEIAEQKLLQLQEANRKAYGEPDESSSSYSADNTMKPSSLVDSNQLGNEIEEDDSAWQ